MDATEFLKYEKANLSPFPKLDFPACLASMRFVNKVILALFLVVANDRVFLKHWSSILSISDGVSASFVKATIPI